MRIKRKSLLAVFKFRRLANRLLGTRRLDYPEYPIFIFTDTIREYETRARSVKKEPKTVSWIEQWAKDGAVLYDIGANVGAYSLIAASRGAKVVAFEPAHQNAYKLQRNIFLNKFDDRVTVVPMALSDEERVIQLDQEDSSFGATANFSASSPGKIAFGQSALAIRLDTAIKMFSLPPPSLIKIDVDGAEIEVLNGSKRLLENQALKSILVEADERNEAQVKNILTQAGFKFSSRERMDEHTVNYIFVRI
jgi:FkbM family methyltransferase